MPEPKVPTPDERLTALEKSLADQTKLLTEATTRADNAERSLALKSLSAEDRAAFDVLSKEDQENVLKAKMKKPFPPAADDEDDDEETSKLLAKGRDAITKAAEAAKKIPAEVQKALDEANARIAKAETAQAASEKVAKELTDKLALTEATKVYEAKYPNLPGTPEDKGKIFKTLEAVLTKDEFAAVEKLFVAGNEALGKMTGELGKKGDETQQAGTADAKLTAIARKMADESNGKITFAKAYQTAVRSNPDLYKQYRDENPAQFGTNRNN